MSVNTYIYTINASHSFETTASAYTLDASTQTISNSPNKVVGYYFPFNEGPTLISLSSCLQIDIEFYTYGVDTIDQLDFTASVEVWTPASLPATYYNSINTATPITYTKVSGREKTLWRVTLGVENSTICNLYIPNRSFSTKGYLIGIKVHSATELRTGGISGINLADGEETGWTIPDTTVGEVIGYPKLYIKCSIPFVLVTEFDLRYTSLTPQTLTTNPLNSLGGYISVTPVYTITELDSYLSTTDTIAYVDTLPTSTSGIAQIGSEIVQYNNIDSTNNALTGLIRNVCPGIPFPASPKSTGKEFVRYLDVTKLFNNTTLSDTQYRCLAIINTQNPVYEVEIYPVNNPKDNVSMDIGIEVPTVKTQTSNYFGVLTTSNTIDVDTAGLYTTSGLVGLVFQVNEGLSYGIITSVTVNGTITTIVLDREITIDNGDIFYIFASPSQSVINDTTPPVLNGNFLGFIGDDGPNAINATGLYPMVFDYYHHFYIWVKRTLIANKKPTNDSGLVLMLKYKVY